MCQLCPKLEDYYGTSKDKNKGKTVEEGIDNGIINYTELPISFLQGWLKF